MRILVTGHEGYIGGVMVRVLTDAGHDVVGLDTAFFNGCTFLTSPRDVPGLRKDVRDVGSTDVRAFDAVVHLAALSNDPMGDLDPALTRDINRISSFRLALAARDAGVRRFVFSSSCSVYGGSNGDLVNEEAPLCPLTPYAESKVRAEEEISQLADSSFSPIFMRNATAYGVSPWLRIDLLLNNLVGWATTTGQVRITSNGMAHRPIVHIEDISRACLALLEAPVEAVHNQAFNVGVTSENYQVRQLADVVRDGIDGCEVHLASGGGADQRDYRVDFSKLKETVPAFSPNWNARTGVQELATAFQRGGLTRTDLESGHKYVRLRRLMSLLGSGELDRELRWSEGGHARVAGGVR
jgi:nucleoside-diphosphate-sugar epimerase